MVVGDALVVGEDLDEQELATTPRLAERRTGAHIGAPLRRDGRRAQHDSLAHLRRDDVLAVDVSVQVSADGLQVREFRRAPSARRHSQPFFFPVSNFAL